MPRSFSTYIGVGFEVGGRDSGINYLLLQVHYANVDKFIAGETDNSGIILTVVPGISSRAHGNRMYDPGPNRNSSFRFSDTHSPVGSCTSLDRMYSIEGEEVKDGIENVLHAFHWAVSVVGLYVTQGDIIWEVYRKFDDTFLGTRQVSV
ncbi:uncharacterized protein LOC143230034 isoform X4 [Tachypleus tridentatus]|uniref:uncharacterized protein LOC143230034 isoform X4 n=1 Tax=Tachypleus tridentatus TaxID=6853 RepID=UPI003FD10B94